MSGYKCGKCGAPLAMDINEPKVQCDKCGSRIFYKDRPNKKVVLKSD